MRPPNTLEAGILLVGGLLAMLALLAWSNCGCVHAPEQEPVLEMPDSGAVDPCTDTSRRVGLLTPEERRLFCLHTTYQPQRECIAGEPCFCAAHPEACPPDSRAP